MVFVFRNQRLRTFRIRDLDRGTVEDCEEVWLTDVKFHVSQSGRLQSIRDGERTVHAGVIGRMLDPAPRAARCDVPVRYNPQQGPYFTTTGHQAIHEAKVAHLVNGSVFIPREVRWL